MIRRVLATLCAPLLATIAVTAVTAVSAAPAQARACQIDHYCVTTFYSDGTYTTVVGQLYEDCAGNRSMWGTRGYPVFVETPC
ncbi:hypothetical protein Nocox_10500 [Nonomuraea coxensis DSM 45129]|uniref:Secreted protein n=1 Tax=Nonomuraea coxensis DSM 45129 TaxID=1122611 RepID=A0ABX8TYW4_9ACTN|nr:DUF6289 family protein [Nonomuraea coxensis]QYC39719.1 hypothetical protein Nocox_10500 [Nonomuraea coxensis DSM 45129]